MELQNTAKYECRSLLNCFSGGTVYDRSVRFDHNRSISKSMISTEIQTDKDNESQVDSTTHLDDDEFNEHIEYENSSQNGWVHVQNSVDSTPVNFSANCFTKEDLIYSNKSLSAEQDQVFSQYSSLPSTVSSVSDTTTSSDNSWQEGNESRFSSPSMTKSTSKLAHKRKQTYVVKDDIFLEVPSEDCGESNKPGSCTKGRKRKTINNKENKRKLSTYQSERPYGQTKMSSILTNRKQTYNSNNNNVKSTYNTITSIEKSSSSSSGGSSVSSSDIRSIIDSNNNQVISSNGSRDPVMNSFLTSPFKSLQISAEFTNPDYFECVQPLEKIFADTEKLITPTIEVEKPRLLQMGRESSSILDFHSNQSVQPSEITENMVFARTLMAKKFGLANFFDTSNDSVMDEIFFDSTLAYKKIELDLNLRSNGSPADALQISSKSINSVSLTTSLNDLNCFGGFVEETSFISEQPLQSSKDVGKNEAFDRSGSSILSSSPDKSFSADEDPTSEETITSSETEVRKSSSVPLKIKIKRVVNDERNEYVIDDSLQLDKTSDEAKATNKMTRSLQRYECADCLEKFRTKRLLSSHVSAFHKGPYDTECEICHMKFKKSSAHKTHLPWCKMNKKFKCTLCPKEYCYNASLKKHLKTHGVLLKPVRKPSIKEEPIDPLAL